MNEHETRFPGRLFWAASAAAGACVALGILAWIRAHDSHTGVGMGGFAQWVVTCLLAGALSLVGLVLLAFPAARRIGTALLSGGLGMFATAWFAVMR